MKVKYSKEWCEQILALEGDSDSEIGAGFPPGSGLGTSLTPGSIPVSPRVFGTFVELSRRNRSWTAAHGPVDRKYSLRGMPFALDVWISAGRGAEGKTGSRGMMGRR